LLKSGHRWSDIPDYTQGQIGVFLRAAVNADRKDLSDKLIFDWMTTHNEFSDVKKVADSIVGVRDNTNTNSDDWDELGKALRMLS